MSGWADNFAAPFGVKPRGRGSEARFWIWYRGPGNFIAPVAGLWTFRLYGPGGRGGTVNTASGSWKANGGNSGAFARKSVVLAKGQVVPVVTGYAQGEDTTVTLPSGLIVAGAGAAGTADSSTGLTPARNPAAVASGGDLNLNGSLGGQPGSGRADSGAGAGGGLGGFNRSAVGGGAGAPSDGFCVPGGTGGDGYGSGFTTGNVPVGPGAGGSGADAYWAGIGKETVGQPGLIVTVFEGG